MRQFIFGLILIPFFLTLLGCEKKHADIIYDKSYANEIELSRKDIALYITRNYIPGTNFAIAKDNKIIYSEGMGIASKELKVPMTRDNKLRIGNVSQLFTNLIYWKLLEEGVLHADSTVQHYIPDYPKTQFKLAIKHLPYHASGIRKENPGEDDLSELNISIQKGLDLFMNDQLSNPPGWFEEWSMFNTNLLGAIMEKASNKKYADLLKEYVTGPLDLSNTVVDNPLATIIGRADFFDQNMMGQVINAPYRDLRYMAPSKGILSNAEDLVKLGMAILESEYFSEEFRENLFEPCNLYGNQKSTMANGWLLTFDENGREANVSIGSVTGGGAAILIYPKEKLVLACATNQTLGNDKVPLFEIANHFLKDLESDKNKN